MKKRVKKFLEDICKAAGHDYDGKSSFCIRCDHSEGFVIWEHVGTTIINPHAVAKIEIEGGRLFIATDGSVGIGSAAPTFKIDV